MNKKCLVCGTEYNPQDSGSFFNFKYCGDECEQKAEINAKSAITEVHMYMCISPLQVFFYDDKKTEREEIVEEGTKWRIDNSQSRGLNVIHLENLSGRVDEKITWLEVDEQALSRHFQKI